jgi:hypothetical protein
VSKVGRLDIVTSPGNRVDESTDGSLDAFFGEEWKAVVEVTAASVSDNVSGFLEFFAGLKWTFLESFVLTEASARFKVAEGVTGFADFKTVFSDF